MTWLGNPEEVYNYRGWFLLSIIKLSWLRWENVINVVRRLSSPHQGQLRDMIHLKTFMMNQQKVILEIVCRPIFNRNSGWINSYLWKYCFSVSSVLYISCFYNTKLIIDHHMIIARFFLNLLLWLLGSVFGSSRKVLAQAAGDAICFTKEWREALI